MTVKEMRFDLVKAVETALATSELVKAVKKAKNSFDLLSAPPPKVRQAGYKPLTTTQIRQLTVQGNTAEDWKSVSVAAGFDTKRISRCHFAGPALLEAFNETIQVGGVSFPAGLYDSTLTFVVVGRDALVRNAHLVHRAVIGEKAVLFDVGTLTIGEPESFANGLEVLIAIETGGREVPLFAELTVEGASVIALSRGDRALLERTQAKVNDYVKRVTSPCNILESAARILKTPTVDGLYLGSSGHIDGAQAVSHVTVLSNADEVTEISHGAIVKSSILQWGCEVSTGAIVDSSLLTEHSHVERHGKVTHSILGPNTGVAEGEVTSALLGPFVGFHHQALLIAALWPEGKGNVGYGANVGSNHTAKAPDQEIWPGEGTFFGLGVNIKFPSDLTRSPYTIIASGVNMLPQRVEFPFSLINTAAAVHPGISPAYNEIMPAWVLSDNIYMVKRNEGKYQKRNKAKRSKFNFEVFRPEVIEMMCDARKRLDVSTVKEVYTSKEIEGLGKNYLLEASRKRAMEIYTFYIRYYALLGLKREVETLIAKHKIFGFSNFLQTARSDPRWEHERRLIQQEFPKADVVELLKMLVQMQEKIAQDVQTSKEKDDKRGVEVIEDYARAHKPSSEDSFIQETWSVTRQLKQDVEDLIKAVDAGNRAAKPTPSHV